MLRSRFVSIGFGIIWQGISLVFPPIVAIPFMVVGLIFIAWGIWPVQLARLVGHLPRPLASAGMKVISAAHRYFDQKATTASFEPPTTLKTKPPLTADAQILSVEADGGQPTLPVGQPITIKFQRAVLDSGQNFNIDTLTVDEDGIYRFDLRFSFSSWDTTADEYKFTLVTSNKSFQESYTSEQLYYRLPLSLSFDAAMDAGDTAYFQTLQMGGSPITVVQWGSYMRVYRVGRGIIEAEISDLQPLLTTIQHYQGELDAHGKREDLLSRILSQYDQLKKGVEAFENLSSRDNVNKRLRAAEHILSEIRNLLGQLQTSPTPEGDALIMNTAPNIFRVIFAVPMRVPPDLTFGGLPDGVRARVIEKSEIGFSVVFEPTSITVETFDFQADAEL